MLYFSFECIYLQNLVSNGFLEGKEYVFVLHLSAAVNLEIVWKEGLISMQRLLFQKKRIYLDWPQKIRRKYTNILAGSFSEHTISRELKTDTAICYFPVPFIPSCLFSVANQRGYLA